VKFLVDAQLPPRLTRWLTERGAERAIHVGELANGLTLPDREVWQVAKGEGWIIVTKDADFLDLSTIYGSPPKVLLVRYGNCSTRTMLDRLVAVWLELNTHLEKEDTRLVIATPDTLEIHRR